jgi:hypothetical protein
MVKTLAKTLVLTADDLANSGDESDEVVVKPVKKESSYMRRKRLEKMADTVSDSEVLPTTKPKLKRSKAIKHVAQSPAVSDDEEVIVKEEKTPKAKKEKVLKTEKPEKKVKRKPSAYNLFVREKMQDEDVKCLPHKDRLKHIAKVYRLHKAELEKQEKA